MRLIPTPRAPEFSAGLRDVESQVAAAVESMRPLVARAEAAGVAARPISFLTDAVGPDLARVAADQGCEVVLPGWHRASLARHVIEALVRDVFGLARCDVAVFVDPEARGVEAPAGDRPVVVALARGGHDAGAERLAARLAASLGTGLRLFGYSGPSPSGSGAADDSRALAGRADVIRQATGLWVVPSPRADGSPAALAFADETAGAALAVVPAGDDWPDAQGFGDPANGLAGGAACPALVVRAAEAADPAPRAAAPCEAPALHGV